MVEFNKIRRAIIAFVFVAPTMLMATEYSLEDCQTKLDLWTVVKLEYR